MNNRSQVKIKKDEKTQSMKGLFELNESLWADVAKEDERDALSYAYLVFEDDFIHVIQVACWGNRISAFSTFSTNAMQTGTQSVSSNLVTGRIAETMFPRAAHQIALRNADPCSPAFVRYHSRIEVGSRPEEGSEDGYSYKIQKKSKGMFSKDKKWVIQFSYDYSRVQRVPQSIPEAALKEEAPQ